MPFQSTPSVGRATLFPLILFLSQPIFQSTPSVGRATIALAARREAELEISIHALRGEGDNRTDADQYENWAFQSTPSVGRATARCWPTSAGSQNFNPRPPWGGRQADCSDCRHHPENFNPRPPWGGRRISSSTLKAWFEFQSTPSVGRATVKCHPDTIRKNIFQSTPSVGRATGWPSWGRAPALISIHALRGEGDRGEEVIGPGALLHFNPRPPWGGRPHQGAYTIPRYHFNPRPPWGGRPLQA